MDVLIAAIGGAVVLVVREVVAAMVRIRTTNSDVDRRERKDETADERRQKKENREALREYIELKEEDYKARGRQLDALQEKFDRFVEAANDRLNECSERERHARERTVKAEGRIEMLEDALRHAGIKFRPYNPDQSDQHRPIQPDPPEGQS